jgi:hypothetical protein
MIGLRIAAEKVSNPSWYMTERISSSYSDCLLKASVLIFIVGLETGPRSPAIAQTSGKSGESLEQLTTNANDPTAILAQLKIEEDYTPSEYGTQAAPNTIEIQPVIPIRPYSLMPLQQLVRPTFKVNTIPYGSGPSTNTQFAETQFFDLLVSRWPDPFTTGLRWAIGPYFVFPTATSRAAGSGTWQAGPAGAVTYRGIPGQLLGCLLQQGTSFAYTAPDRKPVTQLTFQPFFVYQLGQGWYLRSKDATWKFNLRHNTSTEIPLSAGIGKVWKLGEGRDVNVSLAGEWMIYRQFDPQTEQFTLKFQVTVLLPRLEL